MLGLDNIMKWLDSTTKYFEKIIMLLTTLIAQTNSKCTNDIIINSDKIIDLKLLECYNYNSSDVLQIQILYIESISSNNINYINIKNQNNDKIFEIDIPKKYINSINIPVIQFYINKSITNILKFDTSNNTLLHLRINSF